MEETKETIEESRESVVEKEITKATFVTRMKSELTSFLQAVFQSSEPIYLILLTLYVAIFFVLKIAWVEGPVADAVEKVRYLMLSVVMWGSALYLFFIIAAWKNLWKKNLPLIITGAVLIVSTGYFATKMSTNAYGVVFDIVFVILACGKSFRKMLHCILGVQVVGLIVAGIGIPLGFTADLAKPNFIISTHSLGINYPNTWSYLCFLAFILLWYLYLRFRPIPTIILFWAGAAFNYYYIGCRTIAGIMIVFPIASIIVDLIEKRIEKQVADGKFRDIKPLTWLVTVIPFLAFALMMILSVNVEWMYQFYHGPLRNLAWRFLQGGLYFKHWGMPIFGNPYRSNVYIYENVCDEFIQVGILDSSFAAYIIMRGLFWLGYTLLWLCFAHWKALKKRDYAIIFLETILLGFAMMERPGLEMWYNFVLLYPLATVISKPGTELKFEKTVYEGVSDTPQESGEALPATEKIDEVENTETQIDSGENKDKQDA